MSYLVLARKWRPRRFAELVGQEHVVRALTNALATGRVHHAFLFTGTRGVGKTTIARIFAKSLNCERGQGAEPCGECATCLDIDAGRFVDLLEIDAASNTGVDDVREVIENAQYMPSRGRTKVYLIDEVHMLSKPAFNALLKTLEEPPPHVKFLLATTDPQKLPVTVLSRCLQFNLKRLDEAQIRGQMEKIMHAEGLPFEVGALGLLAHGADGSLRDGLSLLDQAIAYTAGTLDEAGVRAMLGTVDRARVGALLAALAAADGAALMREVEELAAFSPDYGQVLDALADSLHRIQLRQLVPGIGGDADDAAVDVAGLAAQVAPELAQLWYQMAISGRRDLPLAPSPRTGFEMSLLRMLAFRPTAAGEGAVPLQQQKTKSPVRAFAAPPQAASAEPASPAAPRRAAEVPSAPALATAVREPTMAAPIVAPPAMAAVPPAPAGSPRTLRDADDWMALIAASGLKGPAQDLAARASFVGYADGVLTLALPTGLEHLRNPAMLGKLADAFAGSLGAPPKIVFDTVAEGADTMHARHARARDERQARAERDFNDNPTVRRYMQQFGAKLVPDSIRPADPE
ncbi:MAG: DNA polymerase III subunit gamma/tau [Proteobacteria bacterium]|nr:DNA polymerase III subunit gamma/tau [Pseudomonadota bacterium]